MIKFIPTVEAKDMPGKVYNYCADQEYSVHYDNDIAFVEDDGNPFAEWLKAQGFHGFPSWVGIFGT